MVPTRQLLFLFACGVASLCYSAFSLPIATPREINDLYMRLLLKNMNTSADPCNDFYSYACGNWANHFDMPAYVDMPGYMDHKVNLQLLETLEPVTAGKILPQAKAYFQSCLELEWPHLNSFLRLVQEKHNFKWPIFYASNVPKLWPNATRFDFLPVLAWLRLYGLNGIFITQNINTQQSNGSHYLIELRAHQQESQLDQRKVAHIFMKFGLDWNYAESLSKRVCDLEQDLQGLSMLPQLDIDNIANITRQTVNVTSLEMNLIDLELLVPQMDWRAYFVELLGPGVNLSMLHLQTFEHNLGYFRQLSSELYNLYSNATIANYIMVKFMYQLKADLPRSLDKSMQCVRLLRGHMPLAANYLYEMYHYNYKRRVTDAALQAMYNRLRSHFEQLMDANFLELNESERAFMRAELLSMQLQIGNIPKAENGTHLEALVTRYYSKLHMDESDFYGNHLELLKFNVRRMQARLANTPSAEPVDFYENDFETSVGSSPVKAFHNAILVPNGYLQLPLYDHRLDDIYQYSLFGFILAHGMMRAFDLFHMANNQHGTFHEQGIQVAQHYSSYINCSGDQELTDVVSENMADVVGLRLAYETYFNITATKEGRATVNSTSKKHSTNSSDNHHDDNLLDTNNSGTKDNSTTLNSTSKEQATGNSDKHLDDDKLLVTNNSGTKDKLTTLNSRKERAIGNGETGKGHAGGNSDDIMTFTRPQLFFINSVQFLCANMDRIATMDLNGLNLGHDMHDVRVCRNWANVEYFAEAFQCAPGTKMNPKEKCRLW